MIKLDRGLCPDELNEDVVEELTKLYKEDKEKDVWNSPKIKETLKKALTDMSHNKCAYCECILDIESKDVTIDHFLPKSNNESLVIAWTNLLPSCLRCNRKKNRKEDVIINPCEINPKEHLGIKNNGVRLKAINNSQIGKNTISVVGLNDIDRVMKPRMVVVEKLIDEFEELYEDIIEFDNIPNRYINRCEKYMSEALRDKEYSAVVSAKLLDDATFRAIKQIFIDKNLWNYQLQEIEKELIEIALPII
ncbi:HNH endonuclease [Intestinibacter sp.]